MYRIHGGTIVCWGVAAVGAAGRGGGACVGVDRVFGGGVSCVILGGSSWWSVVVVPGGWSWALRFLGGCGTCGVGLAGGGGRACVDLRVRPLLPPWPLPLPVPYSSLFVGLFGFVFFGGGGGGAGVLCVGMGVCRCRLLVPRVRGGLTAGGWRQWWRGACVGGCGSWLVSGWRGRAWACVWVCSWRGVMGWWAVWAWLVCVGVGYVCAEGAVGWAGAPWAMQWVEEMLVTHTGGCCRRRKGSVLLTWVLPVMRRAAAGLVTLLVS